MKAVSVVTVLLLLQCKSIVFAAEPAIETPVPTAIHKYVARPEPVFTWKFNTSHKTADGIIYDFDLVSQTWQNIVWKHALFVYEPKTIRHPRHFLLFVTGGSNGNKPGFGDMARGMKLAQLCGARVALLHQVPNQPLLGNRKEDDLITETWLNYLKSGDENWLLLFPMVKSAVKAMDALEQIAQKKWSQKIDGFVITGASKRGWTSWLTPVVDKRIVATAPIVIDVLNFRAQMKHQIDTWGKYSEQIIDYTSKGLIKRPGETESPREIALRKMMDPFTYRNDLKLPKMLINGTNDRYWVIDSMKFYWDDLVGSKYALFVPNAGHSLNGGRDLALKTLAAFFCYAATDTPLPKLSWKYLPGNDYLKIIVNSSTKPKGGHLWSAKSQTRDFRDSQWRSKPLSISGKQYVGQIEKHNPGHNAMYGELQFQFEKVPFSLTTLILRD